MTTVQVGSHYLIIWPFWDSSYAPFPHDSTTACVGGASLVPTPGLRFGKTETDSTNIAPENGPLEKEIPIQNHHFQVLCRFQGV